MMQNGATSFCGYYTMRVVRPDGSTRETREFPNLITNVGLDSVTLRAMELIDGDRTPNIVRYCGIGTGTTPASFSDTQLESHIAYVEKQGYTQEIPRKYVRDAEGNDYWSMTSTYRFDPPNADIVVTEVTTRTVGGADSVFSRALVADAQGSPQPIAVASDEYLYVTYELRAYFDMRSRRFSLLLNGQLVFGTRTIGPYDYNNNTSTSTLWGPSIVGGAGATSRNPLVWGSNIYAYDMPAPAPGAHTPAHQSSSADLPIDAIGAYAPGQLWKDDTYTWGIDTANFATGIKSIFVESYSGYWWYTFDNPIMKTNQQSLKIVLRHTWGRLVSTYTGVAESATSNLVMQSGELA